MKYIIVVDKQSRTNPSSEKRETTIEIEELRRKGEVHDDFVIDKGVAKVYRRIGLSKTHMTYVLDNEVIEELGELKIPLFKGDNYIYIKDEYNNYLCAESITDNEFNNRYVTNLQMSSAINQTARQIDLSVNQKLEGYYTKEETEASIKLTAEAIKLEVKSVKENAVSNVDVMYALSDSKTTAPTSGWSTTAPVWEQGKYMWQKTVTTYADETTDESKATCISGAAGKDGTNGKDGLKGDTGIGVKDIVEQYYLSISKETQAGGSWKTTQDKWEKGKYIWIRSQITWTDNTKTYTTPILATNINGLSETTAKIEEKADSIIQSVTAIQNDVSENVVNGDFKNDLNNWEVSSSGMMGVETINNKKWLYVGIYSYDVDDYISQKITTLMKDTQYRLSFNAYKQESSEGSINASIEFYNKSNALLDRKVVGFTFSDTEQTYSWEFNCPSSFEYAILKFYNKGNPNKEMFIGNISIIGGALWQRVTQLQLTADGLKSEVREKVGNDEIISKINQSAEAVGIDASKIELSANDILNLIAGNEINLTTKNIKITSNAFNVDKNGKIVCSDMTINGGNINLQSDSKDDSVINVLSSNDAGKKVHVESGRIGIDASSASDNLVYMAVTEGYDTGWQHSGVVDVSTNNGQYTHIFGDGIETPKLTQTSLKSKKKNIKKLNVSAAELIKNSDICLYNLKGEKAKSKKHIGLIIGDGYNCPEEVISENGQGIEQYSMTSLAWKAIQELAEENSNLKERIDKL